MFFHSYFMNFDFAPIEKEYKETIEKLSDPELISDWEKFDRLSKRKDFLERVIGKKEELAELAGQITENKEILKDEGSELFALAEIEISQLEKKQSKLEKELEEMMEKGDTEEKQEEIGSKSDSSAAIVEIRAGTGGEEAALFAGDLFKMYTRYAELKGWKCKTLDSSQTELGGFKEIIFEMRGSDVFSKMQYEAGVHRVQRIPTTEKMGRIHTSTASVAVLPKPKKTQLRIRPDDLRIDYYRSSGPGGQYVNRRETAVRVTHLPTGMVVASQTERNQLQNKENAMSILEARLLERMEFGEEEKIKGKRNAQIKWAKRAEKIRTYNFPQDRITDHRIKKSWHNIEKAMDGDLDQIIEDLEKNEFTEP